VRFAKRVESKIKIKQNHQDINLYDVRSFRPNKALELVSTFVPSALRKVLTLERKFPPISTPQ